MPLGFSVDPESVVRLPGAPEFETLDMQITLQTGQLPVGKISQVVPIGIKQGPVIELHLVANIQTPELEVSSNAVNFDRVQVSGGMFCFSIAR